MPLKPNSKLIAQQKHAKFLRSMGINPGRPKFKSQLRGVDHVNLKSDRDVPQTSDVVPANGPKGRQHVIAGEGNDHLIIQPYNKGPFMVGSRADLTAAQRRPQS
jgi:hypothetical protein